jgi:hypothetical protein
MNTRRTLLAAALAAAVSLPALAQMELKLGHVGGPGSLFELSANEFARRANEKLAGKAKVWSSAPASSAATRTAAEAAPGHGRFRDPVDRDVVGGRRLRHVRDALSGEEPRAHEEDRAGRGLAVAGADGRGQGLQAAGGVGERLPQHHDQYQADRQAEDLAGTRLRVPKGKWRVKMFQAYGANPSPMALSEVFVALQTGVMDGQENPLTQIYSSKFQEVQKFLSMTGPCLHPGLSGDRQDQVRLAARRHAGRADGRGARDPGLCLRTGGQAR